MSHTKAHEKLKRLSISVLQEEKKFLRRSFIDAILNDERRGGIELSGLNFRIEALERGHPKNLKYQERKSCYYSLLKIHIINVP